MKPKWCQCGHEQHLHNDVALDSQCLAYQCNCREFRGRLR